MLLIIMEKTIIIDGFSSLSRMYHEEPTMEDSLFDVMIKFTSSRNHENINVPYSSKSIIFPNQVHTEPKFLSYFL